MTEMILGRLLVLFISLSRIASCYAQGEAQIHVWVTFKSRWLVSFLVVECESDLKYLMQPPTEVDCNPYIDSELSLICAVEASTASDISIVWFRRTTINSRLEELTASSERPSGIRRLQSRFTQTGLNSRNDAGEYWCQVRLKNAGTLLQDKSNILILYNETNYQHQNQCIRGDLFVNQKDCLDVAIDPSTLTDPMQSASFSEISPTPDEMDEELDSGKNLVALYAFVAVIGTFCIVIVILTITIVVLYRKKCGPVRFKTEGE